MLADALVAWWGFPPFRPGARARLTQGVVGTAPVIVVKPSTYMNHSGAALAPLLADPGFDPPRDLLVLVDDFALPLGQFRLRPRGSAGGHRGLESVEDALGSPEYPRLRIGIGPLPDAIGDAADFVLAPFEPEELDRFLHLVPTLTEAVECWVREGIVTAMNRFNRRGQDSDDQ